MPNLSRRTCPHPTFSLLPYLGVGKLLPIGNRLNRTIRTIFGVNHICLVFRFFIFLDHWRRWKTPCSPTSTDRWLECGTTTRTCIWAGSSCCGATILGVAGGQSYQTAIRNLMNEAIEIAFGAVYTADAQWSAHWATFFETLRCQRARAVLENHIVDSGLEANARRI